MDGCYIPAAGRVINPEVAGMKDIFPIEELPVEVKEPRNLSWRQVVLCHRGHLDSASENILIAAGIVDEQARGITEVRLDDPGPEPTDAAHPLKAEYDVVKYD